ncbi:hypothetical protein BZA70DRAFT_270510 [Myxozyma melibiosi]|uniref:BRCT domain-containing protein n=1 Tax=Myxozyma melibiosi TaxID=54550 RepID=A0ABR1FB78_9ASCO
MSDDDDISEKKRPLHGFVICTTGLESPQREELNKKCSQLGGKSCENLMNSVTHLVVNLPPNRKVSPKYNFAFRKRSNVMFLDVEFIPKLYDRWIKGDDIDIETELREYGNRRMFGGYTISISGLVDPERRETIKYISGNGGTYTSNLTTRTDVLISLNPSGQKYEFAMQRKIRTVSPLWIEACKKRGALAPIEMFSYDLKPEEWEENLAGIVEKEYGDVYVPKPSVVRKVDDSRRARKVLTKLARTKSDSTWNSMMLQTSSDSLAVPRTSSHDEVVADSKDSATADGRGPFELVSADESAKLDTAAEDVNGFDDDEESRLLEGHVFYFHGFDEAKIATMEPFVTARGARTVASMDGAGDMPVPTHVVLEHKLSPAEIPEELPGSAVVVTDWYLDLSIFHKELIPPTRSKYSGYLGHEIYSPEAAVFKNKHVEYSCFEGMNRTHFGRLLFLLGAKTTGVLDYSCDLLVIPKSVYDQVKNINPVEKRGIPGVRSLAKVAYAREWAIPIIPDEWLLDRKYYEKIGKIIEIARTKRVPFEVRDLMSRKRKEGSVTEESNGRKKR